MRYILKTGPRRKLFQLAVSYVNLKTNSARTTKFIAISQTNYVLLGSVPLRYFGRNWDYLFAILACDKPAALDSTYRNRRRSNIPLEIWRAVSHYPEKFRSEMSNAVQYSAVSCSVLNDFLTVCQGLTITEGKRKTNENMRERTERQPNYCITSGD